MKTSWKCLSCSCTCCRNSLPKNQWQQCLLPFLFVMCWNYISPRCSHRTCIRYCRSPARQKTFILMIITCWNVKLLLSFLKNFERAKNLFYGFVRRVGVVGCYGDKRWELKDVRWNFNDKLIMLKCSVPPSITNFSWVMFNRVHNDLQLWQIIHLPWIVFWISIKEPPNDLFTHFIK